MSQNCIDSNLISEGLRPIGNDSFHFRCHSGVSCYMNCCHKLRMYLYPYDILRLKTRLGLHSADFMEKHTRLGKSSHPFFPAVLLNMNDNDDQDCPFLCASGCSVYSDRPSSCRTYPLERAVEKKADCKKTICHYFMTHHQYCKGHDEQHSYTVRQWERDQHIHEYNLMNDLWAEVDAFFATNPWQGEGTAGQRQQLAFMVCYNIDEFRSYTVRHRLIDQFRLDRDRRRRIERDETDLLKFGFDWLQYVLGDRRTLQPR